MREIGEKDFLKKLTRSAQTSEALLLVPLNKSFKRNK